MSDVCENCEQYELASSSFRTSSEALVLRHVVDVSRDLRIIYSLYWD